ncbi:TPA: hypothetical protein ACGT9B_005350, partial [Klebsiella pneumoniae]
MYHLDNTSGVPEMPEPKEQQSMTPRWFGESQEQGGISWPGADWFNVVQAELLNLLAAAGIEPDKKSYDQLSKAIPKLGDAALRIDLSSSDPLQGGSIVNIQEAKLSELTEISIFMAMTRADINTIRNTPGAEVNVGYALQTLINKGHKSILFPHDVKGIYTLAGDVTVPPPVVLISFSPCVKPYTITDNSSFLNKGAVIRKAEGADYIFGPGTVPRFYGLLLDGRDSSRPLFNQQNQPRGGMLFNCGIYRFLYGIGSYAYTSVQVGMSSICSNN